MGFAEAFVARLQALRFDDTFNPYADTDQAHDIDSAPEQRTETLHALTQAALERGVDCMWVGLAPGHRGARRTGLAFTDGYSLVRHCARWGVPAVQPTNGCVRETSASAVWGALESKETNIFLWNVFPLHPHQPGKPFSNRNLRPNERKIGKELLGGLVAGLKPRLLVAIGREAEKAARGIDGGLDVQYVPHPSRKKREFLARTRELC